MKGATGPGAARPRPPENPSHQAGRRRPPPNALTREAGEGCADPESDPNLREIPGRFVVLIFYY